MSAQPPFGRGTLCSPRRRVRGIPPVWDRRWRGPARHPHGTAHARRLLIVVPRPARVRVGTGPGRRSGLVSGLAPACPKCGLGEGRDHHAEQEEDEERHKHESGHALGAHPLVLDARQRLDPFLVPLAPQVIKPTHRTLLWWCNGDAGGVQRGRLWDPQHIHTFRSPVKSYPHTPPTPPGPKGDRG